MPIPILLKTDLNKMYKINSEKLIAKSNALEKN